MTDIVSTEIHTTDENNVVVETDIVSTEIHTTDENNVVVETDVVSTEIQTDENNVVVETDVVSTEIQTDENNVVVETDVDSTEIQTSDASNVAIETLEETFLNIVEKSLTSQIIKDKLMKTQVNLTPELIEITKQILFATPDCFNDIEKAICEIIKDNKIDSKDIPHLIIVVQKMYQIIYNLKMNSKKRSEITCSVLKYIIHLLVLERRIKIEDDQETIFLTDCDILIDACIGILNFPKSIKKQGCLQKLFARYNANK